MKLLNFLLLIALINSLELNEHISFNAPFKTFDGTGINNKISIILY